ncbi:MAG: alpha/beta fold hydrolase [archaeon]
MKVKFLNSKGGTLVGYLYKPIKKTDKAVIFCHGFMGFKEPFRFWAKYLSLRGFITLAFDFTGSGESDGYLTQGTISQEVSDLDRAITFLKKNHGVKKVCVLAHSMGAAIAVISASENKDIGCIIALSPLVIFKGKPFKDYANKIADVWESKGLCELVRCKRMRSLKLNFFTDLKKYDVLQAAKRIKIPILIIHGDSDSVIDIKEGRILYDVVKVKDKKFYTAEGVGHYFEKHKLKLHGIILDWFRKYLK